MGVYLRRIYTHRVARILDRSMIKENRVRAIFERLDSYVDLKIMHICRIIFFLDTTQDEGNFLFLLLLNRYFRRRLKHFISYI